MLVYQRVTIGLLEFDKVCPRCAPGVHTLQIPPAATNVAVTKGQKNVLVPLERIMAMDQQ